MEILRGMVFVLFGFALVTAAMSSFSQETQAGAAANGRDLALVGHVNLKVLPADIGIPQLGRLMKRYERELGVSCSYCHVEDRDTGKLDYVSEENPKKEIARLMIAMTDDINKRHLAKMGGDPRYAANVTCGTCHQGRANPPDWEARRR